MNLLVTGGAGFIGSHLVKTLIRQPAIQRLVNLDCLTYAGSLDNVAGLEAHDHYTFEKVDLRDKLKVLEVVRQHDISHVIHLAAESHVDRSIAGPGDFIHTNVVGTYHLLESCRECWGVGREGVRFLHVSTDEVFGSLGPEGTFQETSPYAPNSPYSACKAASDMLVRAWHHTYGLPVLTTHSSNNYGTHQHAEKLIPVVIRSIASGQPIPVYGDGSQVRDWLHVQDHVDALWAILERGRIGEVYVVGANNEWSNLDLVQKLCDLCDELAPESCRESRKLIRFVDDRPGHDQRYALDAAKIRKELAWTPQRSFEEGLRETVRWYLDKG